MGRHDATKRRSSIDLRRRRALWETLDTDGARAFERMVWIVLGTCASGFLTAIGMLHLGAPGGYAGAALGVTLTALAAMI